MSTRDIAADFVLGACRARHRELIARKRLYDRALDGEICALETLLSALDPAGTSCSATPVRPGEDLWRRVCHAVVKEQCGTGCGDFACLSGSWDYHGPGIDTKSLWSDKALLIRCAPGAFEAEHLQPDDEDEHIIVIAGDLVIGGRILSVGDYLRIPAGGLHGAMRSDTGCLIFTQYVPAYRD